MMQQQNTLLLRQWLLVQLIFVISSDDEFTLGAAEQDAYNNTFDTIYKGVTLINTGSAQSGATETVHRFHGTATSADGFNVSGIFCWRRQIC